MLIPGLEAAISGAKTSTTIGLNCERELVKGCSLQAEYKHLFILLREKLNNVWIAQDQRMRWRS